ncbi:hypothetical protein B9G39_28825 [Zooshikella ganghwensis]|nr:hypothetical protein B9G39_28825 [Zooshikella ganghwensis]
MPDRWEVAHGLNPAVKDNKGDADNDGRLNEEEYVSGTDPQDSSSVASKLLYDFEDDTLSGYIWKENGLGGYFWRYGEGSWWKRVEGKGREGSTAWTSNSWYSYPSIFSTVVYSTGGLISFDILISSEGGKYLSFYIDGAKVGQWSSVNEYQHVEFLLPVGRHELEWAYQDDAQEYFGDSNIHLSVPRKDWNKVWLDNLFIPALPDSDNDGVIDGWEYHYFNKLDHDLTQDSDEDGVTDFDEFQAGSDPTDALNRNSR